MFMELKVPLTIGIIANHFGTDPVLVQVIATALKNNGKLLEVASHGFNHEDFTTFNLAQQISLLNQSVHKIAATLPQELGLIESFIPPFNNFNHNTLTALQMLGFTHMSSSTAQDTQKPYITGYSNQSFFRVPCYPETGFLDERTGRYTYVSPEEVLRRVKQEIVEDGFAVIMMHPQEHANEDGSPNLANVKETKKLMRMVEDEGFKLTTMQHVQDGMVPPKDWPAGDR